MYPLLQKYQRCRFTDKQISDNITYCVNTPEETMRLRTALASGRDVYVNEALKINAERFAKSRYCHILRRIMTNEWDSFLAKFADRLTRPGLISAVESMIHCGDPKSGFVMYVCPHCGKTVMVCRTCKSRFCPSCGQLARERITRNVTETLADVPHRQMVLSVPPDLRPLMRKYRDPMLDVLFRSAQQALNLLLSWHAPDATKREGRRLGYITFLHTYGRNLCWNPHLHILLAERYMTKDGKMHRFSYFPFDFIRKAFLGILLRNMYRTLKRLAESDGEARKDLRDFYRLRLETKKKYPKGYYVYSPRMKDAAGDEKKDGSRIKGMNALAKYVARYASHPAIAESRIISYNEEKHTVTWYYEPHEDDNLPEDQKFGAITVTDSAEKFISRLLIHVSSKGFKTIRYHLPPADPRLLEGIQDDKILRLLLPGLQGKAFGGGEDGKILGRGREPEDRQLRDKDAEDIRLHSFSVQLRNHDGAGLGEILFPRKEQGRWLERRERDSRWSAAS